MALYESPAFAETSSPTPRSIAIIFSCLGILAEQRKFSHLIPLTEIANALKISHCTVSRHFSPFTNKMPDLFQGKIYKGKKSGIRLKVGPENITVEDIIEALPKTEKNYRLPDPSHVASLYDTDLFQLIVTSYSKVATLADIININAQLVQNWENLERITKLWQEEFQRRLTAGKQQRLEVCAEIDEEKLPQRPILIQNADYLPYLNWRSLVLNPGETMKFGEKLSSVYKDRGITTLYEVPAKIPNRSDSQRYATVDLIAILNSDTFCRDQEAQEHLLHLINQALKGHLQTIISLAPTETPASQIQSNTRYPRRPLVPDKEADEREKQYQKHIRILQAQALVIGGFFLRLGNRQSVCSTNIFKEVKRNLAEILRSFGTDNATAVVR